MSQFELFARPEVHVNSAWQTRIKAADGSHDVDAFELVRPVFLEDRGVLDGIFVRAGCSVYVTRAGIPGRGRIGMVIGYAAVANHQVIRQDPAHRFMEAAANGFVRNLEGGKGLRAARVNFLHRLFAAIQTDRRGVSLEIGTGAVAFDGIAPLRNLPDELLFRFGGGLGQTNAHGFVPRRLDVPDVHQPGQSGGPQPRNGTAARIQGQVIAGALIQPARRHDPGVPAVEITFLRFGDGGLIPGMLLIDWVAQRILLDERLGFLPVLVVGGAEQDAHSDIDIHQAGGDQFAIDYDARSDKHRTAPAFHGFVAIITYVRILERAPATEQNAAPAHPLVA